MADDLHLVCRIDEEGRLVEFQDRQGQWRLAQARQHLRLRGRAQTEKGLGRQKRPKRQRVKAVIWAVPVRLRYDRIVPEGKIGSKRKYVWSKYVCRSCWSAPGR